MRDLLEDSLSANEKKKHGHASAAEADESVNLNTNNSMWLRYKGQSILSVIDEITILGKEVDGDDCAKLAPGGTGRESLSMSRMAAAMSKLGRWVAVKKELNEVRLGVGVNVGNGVKV